jgi:hypothetical protein
MANVKFFRGSKENYEVNVGTDIANGIYFATDTQEILINKKSYGGGISNVEVMPYVLTEGQDAVECLVISTASGNVYPIALEDLLPEAVAEMVMGLSESLVASSSAEKKNFLVHESIEEGGENKLAVREIDADCAKTTEEIVVTGVTVGNLSNGTSIKSGTSLEDLIKQMLMKELDVTKTLPTAQISLSSDSTQAGNYEVGTLISITPTAKYTDGKFTGVSGYSYTLNAGCAQGEVTLKLDDSEIVSGEKQEFHLEEGTTNLSLSIGYGASSATPVTNMGNTSKVSIPAGTATVSAANEPKYVGYVNMFIVHLPDTTTELTSDIIRGGRGMAVKEGTSFQQFNAPGGTQRTIILRRTNQKPSVEGNLGASYTSSFEAAEDTVLVYGATNNWSSEYFYWYYDRAKPITEEETIKVTF